MNVRILLVACMGVFAVAGATADERELRELEIRSHSQWQQGDLDALDALMSEHFRFVAMNGAVETKFDVIGPRDGTPREPGPLRVNALRVEPEEVIISGNVAVVISMLHLDATVRGRPVPPRMRILSVFTEGAEGAGWVLTARSITPLLAPPTD